MLELSKEFRFDAAHTLSRDICRESSLRIHGHSYRARVSVKGAADPCSGMIIDLGHFERTLAETRNALDHRFLDHVPDLSPATMENLCIWIWKRLHPCLPGLSLVTVYRDSAGEKCVFDGQ